MLISSGLCRFRLLSVSSLLLVVSFCLVVYCVGRLTMVHSGSKKVREYKVPSDKWELRGIPEVVLGSFKPHWAVHDHAEQSGTIAATADHRRIDSLSPKCQTGYVRKVKGVCVKCSAGKFSLPGWIACRNLLACDDFKLNVRIRQRSSVDTVVDPSGYLHDWTHYHAEWEGLKAIMVCSNVNTTRNQLHPNLIHNFHANQSSLYAIGLCSEDSCALYLAPHAYQWVPLLTIVRDSHASSTLRTTWQLWYTRLVVVHNVIQVLAELHSTGKYAMCSGTSVEGILRQFLVNSENGQVSLVGYNDVVSRTEPSKSSYLGSCNRWRQQSSQGLFAPEEIYEANRGIYGHRTSIDHYPRLASSSAADLWKVPNIADFMLGGIPGGDLVLDYLSALHVQCKSAEPNKRPSFPQLLSTYCKTLQLLSSVNKVHSTFDSQSMSL